MGLSVPRIWKDEVFQNELAKLDIKMELEKSEDLNGKKGGRAFNMKKYDNRYFDKNQMQKNFKNLKKLIFEEEKSKHQRLSQLANKDHKNQQMKLKLSFAKFQEQANLKNVSGRDLKMLEEKHHQKQDQ